MKKLLFSIVCYCLLSTSVNAGFTVSGNSGVSYNDPTNAIMLHSNLTINGVYSAGTVTTTVDLLEGEIDSAEFYMGPGVLGQLEIYFDMHSYRSDIRLKHPVGNFLVELGVDEMGYPDLEVSRSFGNSVVKVFADREYESADYSNNIFTHTTSSGACVSNKEYGEICFDNEEWWASAKLLSNTEIYIERDKAYGLNLAYGKSAISLKYGPFLTTEFVFKPFDDITTSVRHERHGISSQTTFFLDISY